MSCTLSLYYLKINPKTLKQLEKVKSTPTFKQVSRKLQILKIRLHVCIVSVYDFVCIRQVPWMYGVQSPQGARITGNFEAPAMGAGN